MVSADIDCFRCECMRERSEGREITMEPGRPGCCCDHDHDDALKRIKYPLLFITKFDFAEVAHCNQIAQCPEVNRASLMWL